MATKLSDEIIRSMCERGYKHRGDVRFIDPAGKLCRMEPRTHFEGRVASWYVKSDWDLVTVAREHPVAEPAVEALRA
jgi:hypothetical protein